MTVTITPTGSYVILERLPDARKSQIIEVVGMNDRFGRARVKSIGPDVLDLKVDDIVVVSMAAGTDVPSDGTGDWVIVPEASCIATIPQPRRTK